MLDTMKLSLDNTMYALIDESRFEKHKDSIGRGYFTLVQNPTASELRRGIYKPKLTLAHRFNHEGKPAKILTVEFSVPKLVFGNNFDELTGNEFPRVSEILVATLKDMGVRVFPQLLPNVPVSAYHPAKNIVLNDYSVPYTYIKQLGMVNIGKQLQVTQTDFKNGCGIKYHANSFEIAFYDKVADLQEARISEKRAEEEHNTIQLGLLDSFEKRGPFEVLRFEPRLNQRSKIRQVLKAIGIEVEPTFKNLFSKEISQKILLYYLGEIEEAYLPLFSYKFNSPEELLAGLRVANPALKLNKALEMAGLRLIMDSTGTRGFRELTKRDGDPAWYSLVGRMKQLKEPAQISVFQTLRKQLEEFKPLRLVDFQVAGVK